MHTNRPPDSYIIHMGGGWRSDWVFFSETLINSFILDNSRIVLRPCFNFTKYFVCLFNNHHFYPIIWRTSSCLSPYVLIFYFCIFMYLYYTLNLLYFLKEGGKLCLRKLKYTFFLNFYVFVGFLTLYTYTREMCIFNIYRL